MNQVCCNACLTLGPGTITRDRSVRMMRVYRCEGMEPGWTWDRRGFALCPKCTHEDQVIGITRPTPEPARDPQ